MKTRFSKLTSTILAVLMIVSCMNVFAFAEDAESKIVVCTDTSYVPLEGETVYTTISEAITALGAAGGTIYIKGEVVLATDVSDFYGTGFDSRKEVIIRGYTGADADKISFPSGCNYVAFINLKGDIKFENITINNSANGIHSGGHKITLGEGVVVSGGEFMFGGARTVTTMNKADIYDGSVVGLMLGYQHSSTALTFKTPGSVFNVYGGTIGEGLRNYCGIFSGLGGANPGARTSTGDFTANIYGGNVHRVYFGHTVVGAGAEVNMLGNALINVYGGTIGTIGFGNVTASPGNSTISNSTLIVWSKGATVDGTSYKLTKPISISRGTNYSTKYDPDGTPNTADDKKFITIINNAEEGLASFDSSLTGDYVDYMLKVKYGTAVPVFTGSGTSAVLSGFELTSDYAENTNIVPCVGDTQLVADEETGLYDLSAYENQGEIVISFVDPTLPNCDFDIQTEGLSIDPFGNITNTTGYTLFYYAGEDNVLKYNYDLLKTENPNIYDIIKTEGSYIVGVSAGWGHMKVIGKTESGDYYWASPTSGAKYTLTNPESDPIAEYYYFPSSAAFNQKLSEIFNECKTTIAGTNGYANDINANDDGTVSIVYNSRYETSFGHRTWNFGNMAVNEDGDTYTFTFPGDLTKPLVITPNASSTSDTISTIRIRKMGSASTYNAKNNESTQINASNVRYITLYYKYEVNGDVETAPFVGDNFYWVANNVNDGTTVNVGATITSDETIVANEWATVTFDLFDSPAWREAVKTYYGAGILNFNLYFGSDSNTTTEAMRAGDTLYIAEAIFTNYDPTEEVAHKYNVTVENDVATLKATQRVTVDLADIEDETAVANKTLLGYKISGTTDFTGSKVDLATNQSIVGQYADLDTDFGTSETPNENADLVTLGAQIRLDNANENAALRFVAKFSNDSISAIDAVDTAFAEGDAENGFVSGAVSGYGYKVVPLDLIGKNAGDTVTVDEVVSSAFVKNVLALNTFDSDDAYTYFTVAITDISSANYDRYFAVVPYVTYTDMNGNARTSYGDVYSTASLRSVATLAIENQTAGDGIYEALSAIIGG